MVEVRLHAAQLERAAVEGVVKFQHPGLAVLGTGVALQHTVLLNEQAVSPLLLAGQPPADVVQDLLFQRIARKLLHLHERQVDGGNIGAALRLDSDHVSNVEHDQCLPHGGAADAHLLRQCMVIELIAGLEFHCNDTAADGLVCSLPCTPYCHRNVLLLSTKTIPVALRSLFDILVKEPVLFYPRSAPCVKGIWI